MGTTPISVCFMILFYVHFKILTLAEDHNQFIYNDFRGANLHLDGLAQIHPNGLLQLTNTALLQTGHAFYRFPIRFNTSSSVLPQTLSFSTSFIFAILSEIQNLDFCGHGIAFTISLSSNFAQASPSTFLGLLNSKNDGNTSNHLLAIELETAQNVEANDINDNHVRIDISSVKSNWHLLHIMPTVNGKTRVCCSKVEIQCKFG
ncbi:hypothetical protein ACSBR1_002375 [Camellia fascicularis]